MKIPTTAIEIDHLRYQGEILVISLPLARQSWHRVKGSYRTLLNTPVGVLFWIRL